MFQVGAFAESGISRRPATSINLDGNIVGSCGINQFMMNAENLFARTDSMPNTSAEKIHFLPEFGSFSMLIRFVALAELIAIIITIGRNTDFSEQTWQDFSMLSLFAISFALCSFVVLKIAAPLFRRTSLATGSVLAVVLLLVVTTLGTDGLIYLLYYVDLIQDRWPAWRE